MALLPLLSALLLQPSAALQEPAPEVVRETVESVEAPEGPLPDASFAELIQALGDDGVKDNARLACAELRDRGEGARAHLVAALGAADPQRRFLAAWVLAFLGPDEAQLETVCRTLIPVLGDDSVPGNGMMAGEALRALDKRSRPWVMAALRYEAEDVRDGLLSVMGGRWPYRYSTARGQTARPVFLLGPCRAEDWAPTRLSPPADSEDSRIRYLLDNVNEIAGGWVVDWRVVELLNWHGDALAPYLIEAMNSTDRSRRQFAAALIRQLDGLQAFPPQLFSACIEAFEEDTIRYNAVCASYFLVEQYFIARPYVLIGLSSVDPLVRYRCATVAACADEADLESWVPALVEALGGDRYIANAIGASRLLAERPQTRPWLLDALDSEDAQRREFARRALVTQERIRLGGHWRPRTVGYHLGLGLTP